MEKSFLENKDQGNKSVRHLYNISAVICTHNRAGRLSVALQSLLSQSLDSNEYEILVVDNASTDQTRSVVKQVGLGRVRYLYEPELGLSRARNTGYRHARGRYIAYLDDDAEADPGWLAAIVAVFSRQEKAGCVTGKVLPIWEAPKPDWVSKEMEGPLSIYDCGDQEWELSEKEWIIGTNMAFLKEVLEVSGGFLECLGRKGEILLSAEEAAMGYLIKRLGYQVLYSPRVKVHHYVPAERLDPNWILKRGFWQGVSDGIYLLKTRNLGLIERCLRGLVRICGVVKHIQEIKLLLGWDKDDIPMKHQYSLQMRLGFAKTMWGNDED